METYTFEHVPDYQRDIYGAPSVKRPYCVVCGKLATNDHHVIPNARHATREHPESPTLSLCGMGNASGCHGDAHDHKLHFRVVPVEVTRFSGETCSRLEWEYMRTPEGMDELSAHDIEDGWRACRL